MEAQPKNMPHEQHSCLAEAMPFLFCLMQPMIKQKSGIQLDARLEQSPDLLCIYIDRQIEREREIYIYIYIHMYICACMYVYRSYHQYEGHFRATV